MEDNSLTEKKFPTFPSLRSNFAWTFIGNVIYAGCQWGMLIILAKFGSTEMVGQFSLGLAIASPLFMFSSLALRPVQATDAQNDFNFSDYFALRTATTILALIFVILFLFLSSYSTYISLVVFAICLFKSLETFSDILYGFFQQHERMDLICVSMIWKGILSLSFLSLGIFMTSSVFWGILGIVLAFGSVLFIYDIPSRRKITFAQVNNHSLPFPSSFLSSSISRLFWLTLPLGFVVMFNSLNTNIPRLMIEHYIGIKELGIFSAMAYLIFALNIVVNALGQSASPRLSRHFAEGNIKAFSFLLMKLSFLGLLLGFLGFFISILAGERILSFFYTPEYSQYSRVFVWVMVSGGVGYVSSFLGYGMTAMRCFKPQLHLSIFLMLVTLFSCFWLIPTFHIYGAAYSLVISMTMQALGYLVIDCMILFRAYRNRGLYV